MSKLNINIVNELPVSLAPSTIYITKNSDSRFLDITVQTKEELDNYDLNSIWG